MRPTTPGLGVRLSARLGLEDENATSPEEGGVGDSLTPPAGARGVRVGLRLGYDRDPRSRIAHPHRRSHIPSPCLLSGSDVEVRRSTTRPSGRPKSAG